MPALRLSPPSLRNRAGVHSVATPSRRFPSSGAGFSLIEMVGVLAIMAIVAAMLTPNLAQRVSRMNETKEEQALATIGEALQRYVSMNQVIPGANDWASSAASIAGLTPNEVQYSIPTDTSTARVYLIHPGFAPATSSSGVFGSPLWTQGTTGTSAVTNARVMILGVHKRGLTLPVSSGAATSATAFDNIWNWNNNPATDAPPSGWPTTWNGNGEYLHVVRLNYTPLFLHVTFSNTQYPTEAPYYQIGSATPTIFNTATTFDAFYLQNTFLRLYADNESAASPDELHISHTLLDGVNFIYASDQWQPR